MECPEKTVCVTDCNLQSTECDKHQDNLALTCNSNNSVDNMHISNRIRELADTSCNNLRTIAVQCSPEKSNAINYQTHGTVYDPPNLLSRGVQCSLKNHIGGVCGLTQTRSTRCSECIKECHVSSKYGICRVIASMSIEHLSKDSSGEKIDLMGDSNVILKGELQCSNGISTDNEDYSKERCEESSSTLCRTMEDPCEDFLTSLAEPCNLRSPVSQCSEGGSNNCNQICKKKMKFVNDRSCFTPVQIDQGHPEERNCVLTRLPKIFQVPTYSVNCNEDLADVSCNVRSTGVQCVLISLNSEHCQTQGSSGSDWSKNESQCIQHSLENCSEDLGGNTKSIRKCCPEREKNFKISSRYGTRKVIPSKSIISASKGLHISPVTKTESEIINKCSDCKKYCNDSSRSMKCSIFGTEFYRPNLVSQGVQCSMHNNIEDTPSGRQSKRIPVCTDCIKRCNALSRNGVCCVVNSQLFKFSNEGKNACETKEHSMARSVSMLSGEIDSASSNYIYNEDLSNVKSNKYRRLLQKIRGNISSRRVESNVSRLENQFKKNARTHSNDANNLCRSSSIADSMKLPVLHNKRDTHHAQHYISNRSENDTGTSNINKDLENCTDNYVRSTGIQCLLYSQNTEIHSTQYSPPSLVSQSIQCSLENHCDIPLQIQSENIPVCSNCLRNCNISLAHSVCRVNSSLPSDLSSKSYYTEGSKVAPMPKPVPVLHYKLQNNDHEQASNECLNSRSIKEKTTSVNESGTVSLSCFQPAGISTSRKTYVKKQKTAINSRGKPYRRVKLWTPSYDETLSVSDQSESAADITKRNMRQSKDLMKF